MDILRQEIIEAQKHRTEYIKWKILLVSILGATGLGLTGSPTTPYIELVLCFIPLICAYVDILCNHQSLVVHVIGQFIRTQSGQDKDVKSHIGYEEFAWKVRHLSVENGKEISAYELERRAVYWSSLAFSGLLLIYGVTSVFFRQSITLIPIIVSGVVGIIISIWVERSYLLRRRKIREVAETESRPTA